MTRDELTKVAQPINKAIAQTITPRELVIVLLTSLLSIAGGRGLAIYEAPDRLAKLEDKVTQIETKLDYLVGVKENQ